MKVADMSIEELRTLIKGAVKEEVEELLDVKRRMFELETLQALKEIESGKVKAYDTVEEMLRGTDEDEI
ncbi:MAG: hypothetical protein HZA01_14760 [Nitrospinae bacterium]|nr:hypothetical protein [Nitrospinota bacterium]